MKPSSFLVNVGRGKCVVQEDLVEALMTKKIVGAALDVFEEEPLPSDNPLWSMANVLITPHMAAKPDSYHVPERRTRNLSRIAKDLNSVSHSSTWSTSHSGSDLPGRRDRCVKVR